MKSLLSVLEGWAEFRNLEEGLGKGASVLRVAGLEGAAKAFALAGLFARLDRPGFILASSSKDAADLYDDMSAFLGEENPILQRKLVLLPSRDTLMYEDISPDSELMRDRLLGLWRLARGEKLVVVTTPDGAFGQTLPKARLLSATIELKKGQSVTREALAAQLIKAGYQRQELVEGAGEFSLRGEVIDIWPSTSETPLRLEQFGDEIESLRHFDPSTQRSTAALETITILPARELLLEAENTEEACAFISLALEKQVEQLEEQKEKEAALHLAQKVRDDLLALSQMTYRRGLEYYLPYLWPEPSRPADYLPPETLLILDEPPRLEENYGKFLDELEAKYRRRLNSGLLLELPSSHYVTWDVGLEKLAERPRVELSLLGIRQSDSEALQDRWGRASVKPAGGVHETPPPLVDYQNPYGRPPGESGKEIQLQSGPAEDFAANVALLVQGFKEAQARGLLVVAASRQAERLSELLNDAKVARVHLSYETNPGPGDILITHIPLSRGFRLRGAHLEVFTDGELFGWKRAPRAAPRRRETVTITALSQLKTGDYVVHIHHGIGIYGGLVRQVVDGAEREYLLIKYAGEDKLYVPADQFDRVQKYIGGEAEAPALNKLGGREWERAKSKAKRSARDLAKELVALYAARSKAEGHMFSEDSPWQHELEAGFPYEETEDQHAALMEVKQDMEKPAPMERLVCGDVGFGKTEVAVRAAFKAVMDNKQVAVLVPTTILAAQHFNTFRERMSPYPVRVEMLSRFRSYKECKRVVAELAVGAVDVVIGTHRLLSKDVQFKDLGLLIIDEEQRFGVRHKERLKQLRESVDVITLTATPIPRTLHMTLSGLREMSLINDPPEGRRPVRTQASPRADALIVEAVQRELERGGQVYYVYNRVESIAHIAAHLHTLLPQARIAVGHGQMPEAELEKVMLDFYAGRYDVLLCTTIIENGLDIPNVNTIIVDNADKLGLAQLYQLRGRVGRSDRQAYAYLMWTPHKKLTETAEQRIQAIKEFCDLGSGLKLALRDLEIRGAGNLLGPEQHGFVAAIGFDLYCQMLAEAVSEERGQPLPSKPEVSLDLPVDAFIPDDWVPALNQRIELYRRLAAANDAALLEDLLNEIRDRFGEALPKPVKNLIRMVRIKHKCMASLVGRITVQRGTLTFQLARPRLAILEMRDLRSALAIAGPQTKGAVVEPSRVQVPFLGTGAEELFEAIELALGVIGMLPAEEA